MMEEKHYEFKMGSAEKAGRYLMYVFNIIFLISGGCLFSIAMFVMFDKEFADFIGQIGFSRYYHCALVNMAGGMLAVLASFVGFFGTYTGNLSILYMYVAVTAICFIVNLTGSVLVLATGLDHTYAYVFISEEMIKHIYAYQSSMESKYTVDLVQEMAGCCGAYAWQDWTKIHMPVPDTCRDQVTGNQYRDSCALVVSRILETITGLFSGIALWVCFLQLFTLMFVVWICRGLKERMAAARQEYGD